MENLTKLKISLDEAKERVKNICNRLEYKFQEEEKTIIINNGAMIRFYTSKKGLTIDFSAGKSKVTNESIYSNYMELYKDEEVKNKRFTYYQIENEKIQEIESTLNDIYCKDNYKINEISHEGSSLKKQIKIKNAITNEEICVNIYSNLTLQIDGQAWMLWEDIACVIEKIIKPDICTIVTRITTAYDTEENYIFDIHTINQETNNLNNKLVEGIIETIEIHDYNLILSSEIIIKSKLPLPDYCPILFPILKANEGFLKKCMIDLKIIKSIDLNSNFNFGEYFDNKILKSIYHNSNITQNILKGLELLNENIIERNKFAHSNPGKPNLVITDYTACLDKYNEIFDRINEAYKKLND